MALRYTSSCANSTPWPSKPPSGPREGGTNQPACAHHAPHTTHTQLLLGLRRQRPGITLTHNTRDDLHMTPSLVWMPRARAIIFALQMGGCDCAPAPWRRRRRVAARRGPPVRVSGTSRGRNACSRASGHTIQRTGQRLARQFCGPPAATIIASAGPQEAVARIRDLAAAVAVVGRQRAGWLRGLFRVSGSFAGGDPPLA